LPIFAYWESLGLGWSGTQKSLILNNTDQKSLKTIGNRNLKPPSAENLIKSKSSQLEQKEKWFISETT